MDKNKIIKRIMLTSLSILAVLVVVMPIAYLMLAKPTLSEKYFEKHYDTMMEVVKKVQNGEFEMEDIEVYDIYTIRLPLQYRYLAKGGEIYYQDIDGVISVIFPCRFDIMSEYVSGFLYKSNDLLPEDGQYGSFGSSEDNIRIRTCWFINGIV